MLVFAVYPLASSFLYSLYSWNGLARGGFAGLGNFKQVLLQEPFSSWTYRAFTHNVVVFLSLMVVQNGLAFLIGFALLKGMPGHRFHQVAVFLPVVLSTVIVGFLWKLFLNPIFGAVNQALIAIGLAGWAQPWLGQPQTALASLIAVNTWHWVGFPALVFLAGMQRIPREVLEAARLDGAGDLALMRRVIWPLVAPSATIAFVLLFIGSFNWFELPYIMAGLDGSPGGATDVLGLYFYRTAFGAVSSGLQDFGRGSALAVLMFLFIAAVASIWVRMLRRREIEI
ncbi:MAG: sugar ABC transporter permease [Proteobacteria bacterium]|nr:sugar ABC transporter permease [Pseudomonadota bacterium]